MTIALVIKAGKGAVVAADGRLSLEDSGEIVSDSFDKLVLAAEGVTAFAGALGGMLVDLRADPPSDMLVMRERLRTYKALSFDYLTYVGGHIYHGDHEGGIIRCGRYAAIGSGALPVLGALDALPAPKTLDDAERMARQLIRNACKRVSSCGGRVRVVRVEG